MLLLKKYGTHSLLLKLNEHVAAHVRPFFLPVTNITTFMDAREYKSHIYYNNKRNKFNRLPTTTTP